MSGIIVEYARFVEVQQRRARMVAPRAPGRPEASLEITGSAVIDDRAFDIAESRQHSVSVREAAPQHRSSTTGESVDG